MIKVLDGETRSLDPEHTEYALQPWRVREGKSEMFCIGLGNETGASRLILELDTYTEEIRKLKGQLVYGWNLMFDVAYLYAHGVPFEDLIAVKWVDSMLLWKWVANSQRQENIPAWSLADAVKEFCINEDWAQTFLNMKGAGEIAGENEQYWKNRARFDCVVTAKVTQQVLRRITGRKLKSALIEAACIPQVARSWVDGVLIDADAIMEARPVIEQEMAEIEYRLGLSNAQHLHGIDMDTWTPSKVLRSPAQLRETLYDKWQLPITNRSEKTNEPSTDKATLTYLADDNVMVIEILRWRLLNTQLTKYTNSPLKAMNYLGSSQLHPSPHLFSTYTGRMTYTSKQQKKYPIGMALHQWPREKEFRATIIPPKGYKHAEWDASGQEARLMAHHSGDDNMTSIFIENKDFHSYTGANISGIPYAEFMQRKAEGDPEIVGPHALRYQGKFNNLSNNYRIGVKKQRVQARVQYGMIVDIPTVQKWQSIWHRSFPKIKTYWRNAISKGKQMGYAVTLAGREFKLQYWGGERDWGTSSSAINFPIQGTGADMKELAIWQMQIHFPEFRFWFDLHDGIHYLVPVQTPDEELIAAREMLNKLDYKKYWDADISVPLTWDVQVGRNWAELEEL